MQVSPVYQRRRGRVAGGRRGFQLGFTRDSLVVPPGGSDAESEDSLHRFIQRHHDKATWRGERGSSSEEEEGGDGGERPGRMERQFRVGRHCSARLMLYHGMFHWKHRLLARIRAELKRELGTRRASGRPSDRGAVADGVLANDAVEAALWSNFRSMLDMGQDYQLSRGEEGGGRWRNAVDPHQRIVDLLASLHDDSDGEESDVQWGDESEGEEEEEEGEEPGEEEGATPRKEQNGPGPSQAAEGAVPQGAGAARAVPSLANPTPPSAARDRRLSSGGLRQVDIRNFLGSQGSQEGGQEEGGDDGVRRRL
jgi:hypothetical protein